MLAALFSVLVLSSCPVADATQTWAVIGDSIVVEPSPNGLAAVLDSRWASHGRTFTNFAVGGHTLSQIQTQYTTSVRGGGFYGVVIEGGYNDIKGGALTGAQVFALLQPIIDMARADGLKVVVVNIPPSRNLTSTTVVGYTIDANALSRSYCRTNNCLYADWFTAVSDGATPANEQSCNPAYVSDGIHPNAAGAALMATTVQNVALPGETP